jgi:DNA-binding NtrC family response regulator
VVVVVVTGFPQEMGALAGKAVEQSAYAWLEKPFDMSRILMLLDRINKQKAEGKLEKPGNDFEIP